MPLAYDLYYFLTVLKASILSLFARLDWSAKVTDILGPGYEFVDTHRTKELMLRDLLSHRTGLARLDEAGLGSKIPRSLSRGGFCK